MSKAVQKEPEPACPSAIGGRDGRENTWEREDVTERLLAWHDPCSRCFPDGEIDVDVVVKKRRRGATRPHLHRPE